jgi:hypothetical protein
MKAKLLILCTIFLGMACSTQELCDDSYASELVTRLKTVKDNIVYDTLTPWVSLYGIRAGMSDSLIYDSITTSLIVAPLDARNDFTSFVLTIGDKSDTLRIGHRMESYLVSYTCGFANLFTLEEISYGGGFILGDTIIDEMIDAELEEDEEHLWIYL